jgi:hypothetical protein
MQTHFLIGLLGSALSACSASEDDPTPQQAPVNHRAIAEVCDQERAPGSINSYPDTTIFEDAACQQDSDCVEGANGRCDVLRFGPTCSYDACFEDSECNSGGPCRCGLAASTSANTCMGGNCKVDTDCGEGGYCSPSMGSCGSYLGVVAYWCRTSKDTCVEDTECVDSEMDAGYCAFLPEVGHWACHYTQCIG